MYVVKIKSTIGSRGGGGTKGGGKLNHPLVYHVAMVAYEKIKLSQR